MNKPTCEHCGSVKKVESGLCPKCHRFPAIKSHVSRGRTNVLDDFEKWWSEKYKGMLPEHMSILESTFKEIAQKAWEESANNMVKKFND